MRCVLVLALATAACVRSASFECASADQCMHEGMQGRCEAVSYCSFPDATCPTGQRFGEYAGAYTNQCVGDGDGGVPGDGGSDAPPGDSPAGACPIGYAALPGVANRQYKRLSTAAAWSNHRTGCSSEGSNINLAIPDDMTELAAIATLAGADVWVGINDITAEGAYETVLGMPQTFLPWAPGEPDNNGNQDCIAVRVASTKLETQTCGAQRIAVCECAP